MANGGLPALFAIIYYISGNNNLYLFCYAGSLAFALADTVATEVGLLSESTPRSILTGRSILKGHSGGVTLRGEISAIAGSLIIGTVFGLLFSSNIGQFIIILVACITSGILSTNADSALGETLQCKYRCAVCDKYSETEDRRSVMLSQFETEDFDLLIIIWLIFYSSFVGAALCSFFILAFNNLR